MDDSHKASTCTSPSLYSSLSVRTDEIVELDKYASEGTMEEETSIVEQGNELLAASDRVLSPSLLFFLFPGLKGCNIRFRKRDMVAAMKDGIAREEKCKKKAGPIVGFIDVQERSGGCMKICHFATRSTD